MMIGMPILIENAAKMVDKNGFFPSPPIFFDRWRYETSGGGGELKFLGHVVYLHIQF